MLHQASCHARGEFAEVLDVECRLFLVPPRGEKLCRVLVRAQQPRTPAGISHFAPLAHELAVVPIDALARLFVQVQPDAVDVRGDVDFRFAVRAANE